MAICYVIVIRSYNNTVLSKINTFYNNAALYEINTFIKKQYLMV